MRRPERFTETSVRNCHYTLREIPEEDESHPIRGGSLKSHISLQGEKFEIRKSTSRETNFRKTYLRNLFFENCHWKNSFARNVPSLRTVGRMMPGAVIACPVVGAIVAECRQCVLGSAIGAGPVM